MTTDNREDYVIQLKAPEKASPDILPHFTPSSEAVHFVEWAYSKGLD